MYIPGLGACSALIHLLVQHPKVVLILGLAGAVGYTVSTVGPGELLGSKQAIQAQEEVFTRQNPNLADMHERVVAAFQEVKNHNLRESSEEYVLNTCAACSDLKARDLKSNAELDNEIKFLFFLELVRRSNNDVENAKALFLSY